MQYNVYDITNTFVFDNLKCALNLAEYKLDIYIESLHFSIRLGAFTRP
jgi:hypothetical protein